MDIELDNGVPAGVLNFANIDYKNNKCNWEYYLGSLEVARKIECNILDSIWGKLELNKLLCEGFTFNQDVIEVHKKIGSEIEGVYKDHIFKNGLYYDVVSIGITRSKWESIK